MSLRTLNLAPRALLFFGAFAAMTLMQSLFSIVHVEAMSDAEQVLESNVLPTVRVINTLERSAINIRLDIARLRHLGANDVVRE